ncbi:LysR substrate-binding domain-containing protein, partial [Acidovorax cavernicola]
ARFTPHVVLEVDSLAMVMAAVDAGLGSSLQPWAAMGRFEDAAQRFEAALITDKDAQRTNLLCSLSEDELSPAALAARVVLVDCVRELVQSGAWSGTSPIHHDN